MLRHSFPSKGKNALAIIGDDEWGEPSLRERELDSSIFKVF